MRVIKVSSGHEELSELLLRQTPEGKGIWNNCKFIVNQKTERCDWWVVCHGSGLQWVESTFCDPNHIVYISMEPMESVGGISELFLKQFSHIVLCDRSVLHKNITYANALTWWVGMNMLHKDGHHNFSNKYSLNYDTLKSMVTPEKNNRISVIISKKNVLEGHKKRIAFISKIKEYPVGGYIDIFGGGFNPIPDKMDAIAPYKYHLVLENSISPDYWTEKLADAFLGFAYPIYYGCPNINEYFAQDSLLNIDILNIEDVANTLMKLIEDDPYEKHLNSIVIARNKVLDQYNIFQLMSDICKTSANQNINCTLRPNTYFTNKLIKYYLRNIVYENKFILSLYKKTKRCIRRALERGKYE